MGSVDSSVMGQGASRQEQETVEKGARVAAGEAVIATGLPLRNSVGSGLGFRAFKGFGTSLENAAS